MDFAENLLSILIWLPIVGGAPMSIPIQVRSIARLKTFTVFNHLTPTAYL